MTTATPARVTRVKASHPKASHPMVYDHGDAGDNRSAHGNLPMGLAAAMPFLGAFLGVCCLALAAIIF